MGITLSFEYEDATSRLQILADSISHNIILLATIDIAKTAQHIALENDPVVSTTY